MISSNTYEEVYEILSLMDKLTVMKIPEETLKIINEKRNPEYKTKIDKNDIFNEKNVSKETIDLLCYFDYHYWMDENRKNEVDRIHKLKIQEIEKEKMKKYNPNDVFKSKQNNSMTSSTERTKEDLEIVKYKEQKWYQKLFEKILKIFIKN